MVYTYIQLIGESIELRSNFFKSCKQVINDYPWIDQKKDARITFFTKSFAVLDSVTLCFIFGDKYLSKTPWWVSMSKQYSLKLLDSSVRTAMKVTFDQFVLMGCFHLIFSSMESSLRLIRKEIDPVSYEGIQNNFDRIYSSLFKTLKEEAGIVGWKTKRSSEKQMSIAIYDILSENKYSDDKGNDLTKRIIDLAKRDL